MGLIQSTGSKPLLRFRPRYCIEAALTLGAQLLDQVWIGMCLDQVQKRSVGKTPGIEAWSFRFGLRAAEAQQHDAITDLDEEFTALCAGESPIEAIEPTGVDLDEHSLAPGEIVGMPAKPDVLDGELARGSPDALVVIGAGGFDREEAMHVAHP